MYLFYKMNLIIVPNSEGGVKLWQINAGKLPSTVPGTQYMLQK